jgi:enoyl-CoA hydratase/carnithine racemase
MPSPSDLLVEENDLICTLTLNRPDKRNLLTPTMLVKIDEELKRLDDEGKVRCVVIRGAGDKAFSSGYDIAAIGDNDMMRDYEDDHPLIIAGNSIENFPYPVIAMINGHAFGAGLELAVTCDYRVCVEDARLGMPPAKLGVIYTYTGIRKFLNLVGIGHTKELFLIGNPIDANKGLSIGLVNEVKSSSGIEEYTYSLADDIASNAPLSMKTMKYTINKWQRSQKPDPADEETLKQMILEVQSSSDYKEGQRAFAEKRKPKFKGK